MKIKQFFSITLMIIMLIGLSMQSFSQGCMDAGSDGVNLKGFIQPQFDYQLNGEDADGNSLNENHFTFNRARIGVLGSIPYDIEYYVFMEMSSFKSPGATPHLLDAYVSYTRFGKWAKISLGQFKTPFSLEQNTACSGLYTVNRSDVVNQLAGPQRDLGVMVNGGADTLLVKYSIGAFNGVGINTLDNNINKEIVGRLVFNPLEFLSVGGSFRMGKTNPTNPAEDLNDIMRYGGEIRIKHESGLYFQGEYIMGQDKLNSASKVPIYGGCGGIVGYETKQAGTYTKAGYSALLAYMTPWNLEPVVKYDNWDPDMDLDDNSKNNLTFGINYFVNDYSRVQINYIHTMEETNPIDNDMIILQLQAKF
jgi:phosphate-selective porin